MPISAYTAHRPTSDSMQADQHITADFQRVRDHSVSLVEGLTAEECQLQSMVDCSPLKWHLAHTSWFFETFILKAHKPDYSAFDRQFEYLFNSYYNGVGEQYPRDKRGLMAQPGLEKVLAYRQHVDSHMCALLAAPISDDIRQLLTLGINHEQQHQELMLTDIKHAFFINPAAKPFSKAPIPKADFVSHDWQTVEEGIYQIGFEPAFTGPKFCFDNETPRHRVFCEPFEIATRAISNSEYQKFIDAGGYKDHNLWLSDGWAKINSEGWKRPIYWRYDGTEFTLNGWTKRDPNAAVKHISYYEADAYARWAGARLPTEAEWEVAATTAPPPMNDVWHWTSSSYAPYPGFSIAEGAVGEYNGKFMCNQYVLRGGSQASAEGHTRISYRNFFYPDARWQFSGIRLARDIQ